MREQFHGIKGETLDLLPYGIIILDQWGSILYYNPREEQISGRKRADVFGKNFFTEVAPCTSVAEFRGRFQEMMDDPKGTVDFDFLFAFPEAAREVRISMTVFEDQGQRLCIVAVADETERRRIQRQLGRQERLRAVGETAAGVAHNFNNILTTILGNTQLLLRRVEDPATRDQLEMILRAATDGSQLVGRIRDFGREEGTGASGPANLNALVRDAVAFNEHYRKNRAHRAEVVEQLADELPLVTVNESEIREVLVNLLNNAVDALGGPGTVSIATRHEGGRVAVCVTDTGCGIPDELRDRIFLPFFSTKGEAGTGLGLAVSYAIIQRHGGDLEVESEVGRGTSFTVFLPATAAPASEPGAGEFFAEVRA